MQWSSVNPTGFRMVRAISHKVKDHSAAALLIIMRSSGGDASFLCSAPRESTVHERGNRGGGVQGGNEAATSAATPSAEDVGEEVDRCGLAPEAVEAAQLLGCVCWYPNSVDASPPHVVDDGYVSLPAWPGSPLSAGLFMERKGSPGYYGEDATSPTLFIDPQQYALLDFRSAGAVLATGSATLDDRNDPTAAGAAGGASRGASAWGPGGGTGTGAGGGASVAFLTSSLDPGSLSPTLGSGASLKQERLLVSASETWPWRDAGALTRPLRSGWDVGGPCATRGRLRAP